MKSYENKKFYNYSKKHKGKKRLRSTMRWWKAGSSIYTQLKRQEYRVQCKIILRRKVSGEFVEFPLYRKTMWWEA